MNTEVLSIGQISAHNRKFSPDPSSAGHDHQAASPTTGQTHPHSGQTHPHSVPSHLQNGAGLQREERPSSGSSRGSAGSSMDLYPLSGFLRSVLAQEKALWQRNEILLKSFKNGPAKEEALVPGLKTPSDGTSIRSHPSSITLTTEKLAEDTDHHSKEALHFIRYGQLTDIVHKYFRKLEKRHACLHLTARRAKHETIRHVERTASGGRPEEPPTAPPTHIHQGVAAGSNQAVILREDELLVYRCVLMCAQFPMLSAPNPPDGQSPTPTPPPLPSIFTTTTLQYLQTAHSGQQVRTQVDVHESAGLEDPVSAKGVLSSSFLSSSGTANPQAGGNPAGGNPAGGNPAGGNPAGGNPAGGNPAGGNPAGGNPAGGNPAGGNPASDTSSHLTSRSSVTAGPSQPIQIKGGKSRNRSIRKHSTASFVADRADASSLAKLPPGDSDEEAELVKLMSTKKSWGVNSSPSGREHPFTPMVSREMLYSMVRRAFKQSEEQQVNFESSLKRENGRRSKGEILAKELAGQLQVLDNNAHPFYKPKLFVTRNGYDLWLQGEKERVRKLIDKFWHCSLPRPQLWRNYNPIDYHCLYTTLLRKIVDCESRTDRKEPVHSGRTPSSPLSHTALRLLTEFGLRYGVGDLYRRIAYLEYLAKHFDYEIWYIKHCTEELRSIRVLLPRNRNRVTAVRPEMEVLRATIHLLHGQADNSLTRVDRLFLDTNPRKGVASLIELLAEVLDAQQNLFGKRVQPVEKWLKRYLKSGFILRYERRKEIASDETVISQSVQPFVLTPTLVNSLLLGTRDEVYEFRDKFQSVFRAYFDVVPFSKVEFYRLLCADACSLCARKLHKDGSRKSISLEMLGLMFRLNERDIEWQGVIEPELQLWRQHYQNLACVWLDILGQQINKWTIQAVEEDQWTLLSFDAIFPHVSALTTPAGMSYAPSTYWHKGSTHIVSSIRLSPFPSPAPTLPMGEGSFNNKGGLGGRRGAFTPYRQIMKRQKTSPVLSESSGAVTDSLPTSGGSPMLETSSSTSIAGALPLDLSHGARKRGSPVSRVTFGPRKGVREIEVSASVYSGSDEFEEGAELEEPVRVEPVRVEPVRVEPVRVEPVRVEPVRVEPAVRVEPVRVEPVEEVDSTRLQPVIVKPGGISTSHSSEYLSCKSDMDGSLEGQTGLSPGSDPDEMLDGSFTSNNTLISEHAQYHAAAPSELGNGSTGQLPSIEPLEATPQATPSHTSSALTLKFNNLLDKCDTDGDSDTVRSKPRVAATRDEYPPQGPPAENPPANQLRPPPGSNSQSSGNEASLETMIDPARPDSSPVELSPSPLDELKEDSGTLQPFLFPVSNSPVDLVTMLSRLASFTGELLTVLTPKIRKATSRNGKDMLATDGYAPEVTRARQQASERQKEARNMKEVFLKRLNRVLINSFKLYADNMLCMDLCGWTSTEASKLLGEQELHHLSRRKDTDEIWGCRHMVEAKHGLHPNGIPCAKKHSNPYEHITRDMCIRINNIHVLITTFHSLEAHLYSMIRTGSQKPISAFGYISSDPSESTPNLQLLRAKSSKPHPTRTRQKENNMSPFLNDRRDGGSSLPSSVSTGLGAMEPDHSGKKQGVEEVDPPPTQSLECLEYLKKVQSFQVKMIAIRMNKFCKMALSELLGLKLNDCAIDKRLFPVVDYLERHRVALQKYVYPDCFSAIMEHVWEGLLQDLEDEALKLRASKHPVTKRAQMLLQALSHLIEFMYKRKNGLDIDRLNSTSEYLQGVLDIMARSTDQLITIFNKLNNAHFNRNVLDLSQAPVMVDSRVLSQLRLQLRSNKKCFTGEEFIGKVMEFGRGALAEAVHDNDAASNSAAHVLSPTGQPIEYNEDYAASVAQYLLDEGILIRVSQVHFQSDGSSTVLLTPEQITEDSDPGGGGRHLASSFEGKDLTDSVRPLGGGNSAVSFVSGAQSAVSFASSGVSEGATSAQESPGQGRHTGRAVSAVSQDTNTSMAGLLGTPQMPHYQYNGRTHHRNTATTGHRSHQHRQHLDKPVFSATASVYYKFASSEDDEFFQSHILVSSLHLSSRQNSVTTAGTSPPLSPTEDSLKHSGNAAGGFQETSQDFVSARQGTLCLVYDLLSQRARKERVAKQFLGSPRVQDQQRQAGETNCDLIFRM